MFSQSPSRPLQRRIQATASVALVVLVGLFTGCDAATPDMSSVEGDYLEFGERALLGREVVFSGLAGVYIQHELRLHDSMFTLQVESDLDGEAGIAAGQYDSAGRGLRLHVESSTTPLYAAGTRLVYDQFQVVEASFQMPFDQLGVTFAGPGLILTIQRPDTNDIDRDGDQSETLTIETYYSRR